VKLHVAAAAIGALILLAASNPLAAQWVWLGGGATVPLSDFADYGETGLMLAGGFAHSIGESGLNIGVEGSYGQNNHKDIERDGTNPIALMGRVGYDFSGPNANASLYTFAGLGILWHKFTLGESADSGLGLQAGAGYYFPLGSLSGWVEGRFVHAGIEGEHTTFVGALAGISIPLGMGSLGANGRGSVTTTVTTPMIPSGRQ